MVFREPEPRITRAPTNRVAVNLQSHSIRPGVLTFPCKGLYYPYVLHAAFRQKLRPTPMSRKEHTHSVYHLCVATSGEATFLWRGRIVPVKKGAVFLVSPGEPHAFVIRPGESMEYCEVTFQLRDTRGRAATHSWSEILRAWGGHECRTHVPGELISPSLFGDLVSQIERLVVACLMNSHHGVFLMHQNLHELCGRLFGFFSESLQNRELDPLQRAHQFLLDHYTRSFSLSEIGSRVGLSPNYLSRAFRQRYGQTPIYYQQTLRHLAARRLLESTDYPLKAIADLLGFGDEYFFSRIFRRLEGVPPGRYRKRHL